MVRVPSHINIIALGLVPRLFLALVFVGFPLTHSGFQGFRQELVNGLGIGINPVDVRDFPIDVEKTSSQVPRPMLLTGIRAGSEVPM
eukprot:5042778-Heterocapsa_arctica.AAC.1